MLEHMTTDELLDDLPPAERAAIEYEAELIARPWLLATEVNGDLVQESPPRRWSDISD
ncbi:hypothetical protein VX159_10230 [Dechloromonas sp. ZY10]|uniref:hypothetical protein n=1 Tax=Dechloromonas aquae TaxID=2664436 RepID=UPI0035279E7E